MYKYRYSWPDWFPYPKSLVRGGLVGSNLIVGLFTVFKNNYFNYNIDINFLIDIFIVCLAQIIFFTVAHVLWGIVLQLLHRKWYENYRKGWFHLLEGLNAFLVSALTFPFLIIVLMLIGIFIIPISADSYNWLIFARFLLFGIVGLVSSCYYHVGYLFWSWLNHKNKSLNQQYYENQDLQNLKVKMHQEKLERMKNKPWRQSKNKSKSYKSKS